MAATNIREAVEDAILAIEKQVPRKPVGVDFDMVGCASCKMVVVKRRDKYCPNCGQKQDWEE